MRLTEDELIDKRGFCAICDARFDVTLTSLAEASPWREWLARWLRERIRPAR